MAVSIYHTSDSGLVNIKIVCTRRLTVVDGLLADVLVPLLQRNGPLDIFNPVVDAPKVKGDVLAEVTHNDLQLGKAVKDTVDDQSEQMQVDTIGKRKRRADQELALRIQLVVDDILGRGRVDVQRDVQLLQHLPEHIVRGLVVEEVRLAVGARVLEVAQQGAVETQLLDAARQLSGRLRRVVHGETGESAQLVRLGLDLLRHPVVNLGGAAFCFGLVGDALDPRDGERDDGVADAVLICELDALLVDVADGSHVFL